MAGLSKASIRFSPDWLPGTIIKFSRTVKFVNSWAIWKVLSNPFENNSYDGTLVISSLLNITFPFEVFKLPAIKLNKVVFPDPLGPIMPVIEPFLIFKEQSDTAAKPPKYLERLSICRIFESDCIDNYTFFNLLRIVFAALFNNL